VVLGHISYITPGSLLTHHLGHPSVRSYMQVQRKRAMYIQIKMMRQQGPWQHIRCRISSTSLNLSGQFTDDHPELNLCMLD